MRRLALLPLLTLLAVAGVMAPANAITFGKPDGNLHPNVGALLADWDEESPGPDIFCTGTLIDVDVFLTAGHCTDSLASAGITQVWVTFEPEYDEDAAAPSGIFPGSYVTHPDYGFSGPGGMSDPHDIAVVLLESSPGITPAVLPTEGLLDEMKAQGDLKPQTFTAVGYGTVREEKTKGPHAFFFDGIRRYALQSYLSLQASWLTLSMQPSKGDGGTCYGDSGGPHFLGGVDSNVIVSITVTGDAMCRATDKTYRVDTASSREFLDDFVTLP